MLVTIFYGFPWHLALSYPIVIGVPKVMSFTKELKKRKEWIERKERKKMGVGQQK